MISVAQTNRNRKIQNYALASLFFSIFSLVFLFLGAFFHDHGYSPEIHFLCWMISGISVAMSVFSIVLAECDSH